MGRPKSKGNRSPSGRKKKASTTAARLDASRVLPTPETVAYIERRVSYWLVPGLWNLAAAEQAFDNTGILWLTGWFDGHGFASEDIRNVLREYAGLYWRWYADLTPKVSKGERSDRAEPRWEAAGWERKFQKLDERLKGADRKAVHELCVNGWFADEFDPRAVALSNLGRIRINAARKLKLPIAGEVAGQKEIDWLNSALRGAFALLDARLPAGEIPLWRLGEAA